MYQHWWNCGKRLSFMRVKISRKPACYFLPPMADPSPSLSCFLERISVKKHGEEPRKHLLTCHGNKFRFGGSIGKKKVLMTFEERPQRLHLNQTNIMSLSSRKGIELNRYSCNYNYLFGERPKIEASLFYFTFWNCSEALENTLSRSVQHFNSFSNF